MGRESPSVRCVSAAWSNAVQAANEIRRIMAEVESRPAGKDVDLDLRVDTTEAPPSTKAEGDCSELVIASVW